MEREQAAEEFARVLHRVGVDQAYQAFFDGLNNAKGTGPVNEKYREIEKWYTGKAPDEQRFIRKILKEVLNLSVFGLAVHFDGAGGFDEIEEQVVEFSVGVSVYGTLENAEADTPLQTLKICPTEAGEEVHDIFSSLIDEAGEDA